MIVACSSAGTDQISDSQLTAGDESDASAEETGDPGTATASPTSGDDSGSTGASTSPTSTDPTGPETGPETSGSTDMPATSSESDTASGSSSSSGDDSTGGDTTTTGDTTTGDTTTGDSSTGTPEGCDDSVLNGDETDLDCGGATCAPCPIDDKCLADGDCASGSCEAELCVEATCADAKKDGDETDIDCGGPACDSCLDGQACELAVDCVSSVCDGDLCIAAACDDKVRNQDETAIDCGGLTCDGCGVGLACIVPDDCDSGVCTNALCVAGTCNDAVQNGMETGVDCGSPSCAPCQLDHLIINEIDYDTVGSDNAEFVEIYNNTGATVDLTPIRLVLINGNGNATYLNLSLAAGGSLQQGQYLVVANAAFVAPPGVVKVNFAKANDNIENGAPDGVALVDTSTMTLLDALSYEGPMTMATVTGVGVTSLVEGTVLAAKNADSNELPRSLVRFPNGNDKNDAATDWVLSKNPSPGAANVP